MQQKVVIAGAGISGCFLAYLLAKKGFKVTIFERNTYQATIAESSKRSYAITLYGYGLNVLKENGLWNDVKKYFLRLNGSYTFISNKTKPRISKFCDNVPYFAVSRPEFLKSLIKINRKLKIKITFNTTLKSIDFKEKTAMVVNNSKNKTFSVKTDFIIGCDGVHSNVREFILKAGNGVTKQHQSDWIYRQVVIPKEILKKLNASLKYAASWTSKDIFFIAFPNMNKSMTGILVTHKDFKITAEKVLNRFPNLLPAKKEISYAIKACPLGNFSTVHTNPWFYKDFAVILGDAAHAFNPFFGQGVSAALGDCVVLSNQIGKKNGFLMFQNIRKKNMDILGKLSKKGFKRFRRNAVIDKDAIFDKLEAVLHTYFPFFIKSPLFENISSDPGKTDLFVKQSTRQKKLLYKIGINHLVKAAALFLTLKDFLNRRESEVISHFLL